MLNYYNICNDLPSSYSREYSRHLHLNPHGLLASTELESSLSTFITNTE